MEMKKKKQFSGWNTMRRTFMLTLFFFLAFAISFGAQTKPPATFADYGQWETLARAGSYGGFSPDGKWLAYGINRTNGNNELRITKLASGKTEVVAFGSQAVFSSDSRWIV